MKDIVRKNPRKLNTAFLTDIGKGAAGVGGLYLVNRALVPKLMETNPNFVIPLVASEIGVGLYLSRKMPWLGGSIAGAGLGATLTALLAYVMKDPSMAAMNPAQEAQIKSYLSSSNIEGFSENLLIATGAY